MPIDAKRDIAATTLASPKAKAGEPSASKVPRTPRGERTLRALLDAAAAEFGEKGFHEGSISGITSRAGVALGSFYTYFDSKDEVFRALVRDMSDRVRDHVGPAIADASGALAIERVALDAFLRFARQHKEIYRIVDEAEFVDPASFRSHYATTAERIRARLNAGAAAGELRADLGEVEAWAMMGMNVFLGLRFGVWDDNEDAAAIADAANRLLSHGIAAPGR
jgi:AcrR family transcriptional regulator